MAPPEGLPRHSSRPPRCLWGRILLAAMVVGGGMAGLPGPGRANPLDLGPQAQTGAQTGAPTYGTEDSPGTEGKAAAPAAPAIDHASLQGLRPGTLFDAEAVARFEWRHRTQPWEERAGMEKLSRPIPAAQRGFDVEVWHGHRGLPELANLILRVRFSQSFRARPLPYQAVRQQLVARFGRPAGQLFRNDRTLMLWGAPFPPQKMRNDPTLPATTRHLLADIFAGEEGVTRVVLDLVDPALIEKAREEAAHQAGR